MVLESPAVFAQIVSFGMFLWLGLYVLIRHTRVTALLAVSLAGLFTQALFFGAYALTDTRTDAGWFVILQRWTFWTSVLPAATWYHLSSLIARRTVAGARGATDQGGSPAAPPAIFPASVVAVYTAAAILTLIGTASDLIVDYARPRGGPGAFEILPGPAYIFYMAYLALAAAGALVNLLRARRAIGRGFTPAERAQAKQIGVLAAGALFFLAGGVWLTARKNWGLPISPIPGFVGLLGGLAALGYGVAIFGLLLEGQDIQRDFLYNLTGIGMMNLLYGGLLAALPGSVTVEGALGLVTLVTATHTLFDAGRNTLDVLFFSRAERAARAEARDYATALGTAPVTAAALPIEPAPPAGPGGDAAPAAGEAAPAIAEQGLKAFQAEIRKALTGLKSPPRLAMSPLLGLALVEHRVAAAGLEDNRLNRAAALRELLIERIEGLRPTAADAGGAEHHVGEAWRFYNVLYYPYVRELSRKAALAEARRLSDERRRNGQRGPGDLEQVLSWLADVDEDTFYKWQRRASDTIAAILWEERGS